MSKLTFRADDDLVTRLEEEFDASKSEVLREALREYIERHATGGTPGVDASHGSATLDDMVAERVDDMVAERLGGGVQDINVNITLEGPATGTTAERAVETATDANVSRDASHGGPSDSSHNGPESKTDRGVDENASDGERKTCTQCGEVLSPSHVYCPNCGEKTFRRVFCECGDELRSDWAHCPSCGRRTPAAEVLDDS